MSDFFSMVENLKKENEAIRNGEKLFDFDFSGDICTVTPMLLHKAIDHYVYNLTEQNRIDEFINLLYEDTYDQISNHNNAVDAHRLVHEFLDYNDWYEE